MRMEKWDDFRRRRDKVIDRYVYFKNLGYKCSIFNHHIIMSAMIKKIYKKFIDRRAEITRQLQIKWAFFRISLYTRLFQKRLGAHVEDRIQNEFRNTLSFLTLSRNS